MRRRNVVLAVETRDPSAPPLPSGPSPRNQAVMAFFEDRELSERVATDVIGHVENVNFAPALEKALTSPDSRETLTDAIGDSVRAALDDDTIKDQLKGLVEGVVRELINERVREVLIEALGEVLKPEVIQDRYKP